MSLWGGRFDSGPSDLLWAYTVETADQRLLKHDVFGSIAHARMLGAVGLISDEERDQLVAGLTEISHEGLEFLPTDEDVHSAVERRLFELVGDVAGKLHTGRSRNDQVSLDLRLFMAEAADDQIANLSRFVLSLVGAAETNAHTAVASYTHLQQAQVTSLGHHLLAYAWMAKRDAERFADFIERVQVSPLGAGASVGSSLPLEPSVTAELLGWEATFDNSMEAVASRDLAAEFVFICSQAMVNLSRLAEEIVMWASQEFRWMTLPDDLSTGSSAMPHKKNPDIAELARGRAKLAAADAGAVLGLQAGLPLTYNRDLQEDKRLVFGSHDRLMGTSQALGALVAGSEFHPPRPSGLVLSLDVAEVLVSRGVPFRTAHEIVGGLVAEAESHGHGLHDLSAETLAAAHESLTRADLPTIEESLERRAVAGSGSPADVAAQVIALKAWANQAP